jgi:hypothetical protein
MPAGKPGSGKSLPKDLRGVSPILGFILLLMILMTALSIVQSTAVPQWNRGVEARHLDALKYEVADIGRVTALSASTGNPGKVLLHAGVSYPEYYVLVSPYKASTTVSAVPLQLVIRDSSGSLLLNETSAAIIVQPNYFYSPRVSLIHEHSATLREEPDGTVLAESDQGSFSKSVIHIAVLKPNFYSFATTETASIVLIPESYGGSQLFSGSIEFECYDENTARWWNNTLSSIYGPDNVTVVGNRVRVSNLQNITLSVSVFSVFATYAGEVSVAPQQKSARLVNITQLSLSLYQGSTAILIVKTVDSYGNPVRGVLVSIYDSCSGSSQQTSDENGLVIYYFNAACVGENTVTFSADSSSLAFSIFVLSPPGGGGGGGTFNLLWYKEKSGSPIYSYEWNVSRIGNTTDFYVRATFEGNPAPQLPLYFAFNNSALVSRNDWSSSTDSEGWGFINLTANMNGSVAVVAVALDSAARLNITVTGLITNNPPSQPAIQTDKKYYYSGETITATASGSVDPDGDPVTYYYKFYDLTSGTTLRDWGTSNTYTIGSSSEGHVIRVYARACDDKGACSSENFTDVGVIKVLTLYPTDNIYGDAYVYDLASDTNYGNLSYLISGVSKGGGGVYRTYIKFNLSSIPLGSTVLSARLNLVYYNARSGCVIEVYTVSGVWYENNITWSNAPQPSSLSDSNSTTGSSGLISWNVKSDVQNFVNGAQNYGWVIKHRDETTKNTLVYFYSRESSTNKPNLVVEYAPTVS